MLIDLRTADTDLDLEADLCIVGAGIAGLTIARELAGTNVRTVVLESGGSRYEEAMQDFNAGATTGMRYYDLRNSRMRFAGGTINVWGGRWAMLNDIDFERRDWVPYSGWPIGREDLLAYYRRVHERAAIGAFAYDESTWPLLGRQPPPFDVDAVRTDFWHWSPEAGHAQARTAPLAHAPQVTVVLHATVVKIAAGRDANAVERLEFADAGGRRGRVRARHYVLAAGGVENARMLLAANDVERAGIGNAHDQVGRYFMEHPHCRAAEVIATDPVRLWRWFRRGRLPDGTVVAPMLRPGEAEQRRAGLLNSAATLKYQRWPKRGLPAGKLVTGWAKENLDPNWFGLAALKLQRHFNARVSHHLHGWIKPWQLRFRRGGLFLVARAEQAPNPASRVLLSATERDALGVPRVELNWQLDALDKHSVVGLGTALGRELERLGLGRTEPSAWLREPGVEWPIDRTVSYHPIGGYHHMGTTRMSGSPRTGVVDRDCKVHGYHNLHVAGSSVFTTAGWANPTFTLTALALRLADRLRDVLGRA
jgi:choline dehydrogenase-like flavoprotein